MFIVFKNETINLDKVVTFSKDLKFVFETHTKCYGIKYCNNEEKCEAIYKMILDAISNKVDLLELPE